jgi:hypothetical protein
MGLNCYTSNREDGIQHYASNNASLVCGSKQLETARMHTDFSDRVETHDIHVSLVPSTVLVSGLGPSSDR